MCIRDRPILYSIYALITAYIYYRIGRIGDNYKYITNFGKILVIIVIPFGVLISAILFHFYGQSNTDEIGPVLYRFSHLFNEGLKMIVLGFLLIFGSNFIYNRKTVGI